MGGRSAGDGTSRVSAIGRGWNRTTFTGEPSRTHHDRTVRGTSPTAGATRPLGSGHTGATL
jgi:hypothetical protein